MQNITYGCISCMACRKCNGNKIKYKTDSEGVQSKEK